jgi:hypothetical protein
MRKKELVVAPGGAIGNEAEPQFVTETEKARRWKLLRAICETLETGTLLVRICGQNGLPSRAELRRWCEADEALGAELARARESGYDALAELTLELADMPDKTTETKQDKKPIEKLVENRKLQVETRLRLLAKWCPHRYGDEPRAPAIHVGVGVQVQLTEERRAELMAKKRAAIEGRMKGEA